MDFESQLQLNETEAALIKQHAEYFKQHPTLNNLMSDFVSQVLLEKPQGMVQ